MPKVYRELSLVFEVISKVVGESLEEEKIWVEGGYEYKAEEIWMGMLPLSGQPVDYKMRRLHLTNYS